MMCRMLREEEEAMEDALEDEQKEILVKVMIGSVSSLPALKRSKKSKVSKSTHGSIEPHFYFRVITYVNCCGLSRTMIPTPRAMPPS
jgi:hypothetical protein